MGLRVNELNVIMYTFFNYLHMYVIISVTIFIPETTFNRKAGRIPLKMRVMTAEGNQHNTGLVT